MCVWHQQKMEKPEFYYTIPESVTTAEKEVTFDLIVLYSRAVCIHEFT